jgi:hypothetical protein
MTVWFDRKDPRPVETLYSTDHEAHATATRAVAAVVLGDEVRLARVNADADGNIGVAETGGGVPLDDRKVVVAAGVIAEYLVDDEPATRPNDIPAAVWERARTIAAAHWLPIEGLAGCETTETCRGSSCVR